MYVKRVWLPRGIVIPWAIAGAIWKVNIRRPIPYPTQTPPPPLAAGPCNLSPPPKYIQAAGGANGLYAADELIPGRPAIVVEGELDALVVWQAAGDLTTAVATGSTSGARGMRWIVRLALGNPILVATDNDGATKGEQAARYWLDALGPSARRWRPYLKDPSDMARANLDLRAWIETGLAGPCATTAGATVGDL